MKTILKNLIAIIILFISFAANSQTLFVENFNYPVRDSLEGIGGWNRESVNTPYNIKVKSQGLTYAGYLGSGIGNTASILCHDEGDICYQTISTRSSGCVYLSFLIRVDSLSAATTQGYNICLDESDENTNLNTKSFIKRISASTFNFGIMKTTASPVFSPTVYSANTTYLVVAKYTFVAGTNNDSAKIYVFSSGVPSSEPSVPTAFSISGFDMNDIGEVALTNSFAFYGLQGSSVKIDGIRAGTTWSNTLLTNAFIPLNLNAMMQGFYNSVTNKMIKDTARVYLRFSTAPYAIADSSKAILDSLGNGQFFFSRITNYTPYYIAVRHRNSIETWSSVTPEFMNNSLSYTFTDHFTRAYGNNLKLKGTKYCTFSGDVNQDGIIDATDLSFVDNHAFNFAGGYLVTDLNGDAIVDGSDALIADNNAFNFVSKVMP